MTARGVFRVDSAEVREGDLLLFLGTAHLINRIEPYEHPAFPDAEGWRIAHEDATGWAVALIPGWTGEWDVLR